MMMDDDDGSDDELFQGKRKEEHSTKLYNPARLEFKKDLCNSECKSFRKTFCTKTVLTLFVAHMQLHEHAQTS